MAERKLNDPPQEITLEKHRLYTTDYMGKWVMMGAMKEVLRYLLSVKEQGVPLFVLIEQAIKSLATTPKTKKNERMLTNLSNVLEMWSTYCDATLCMLDPKLKTQELETFMATVGEPMVALTEQIKRSKTSNLSTGLLLVETGKLRLLLPPSKMAQNTVDYNFKLKEAEKYLRALKFEIQCFDNFFQKVKRHCRENLELNAKAVEGTPVRYGPTYKTITEELHTIIGFTETMEENFEMLKTRINKGMEEISRSIQKLNEKQLQTFYEAVRTELTSTSDIVFRLFDSFFETASSDENWILTMARQVEAKQAAEVAEGLPRAELAFQHAMRVAVKQMEERDEKQAQEMKKKSPIVGNQCANCAIEENLKSCSRCRLVWYCGTACQKQHWKDGGHRRFCVPVGDRVPSAVTASTGLELCPICFEELNEKTTTKTCGHKMHTKCIEDNNEFGVASTCPVCRS